ncbi:STAS domain-containing protein [Streptomyces misionensis]|uniref:STAS domain-containing protein n=1 Tax=Streptomyces misionensis TaxID=67331 RepID=A0A5C6IRF9_9ACTN|nr:STAS domain-containing protein [Streptomyces misionensis]TWV31514.1 STAS domain-containing protein [Streptomyces misionensis]
MTGYFPAEFSVEITEHPASCTVRIAGELDYDTSDELVEAVVGHLRGRPHTGEVRLDFTGLTWIDSSGLSALLMIHRATSALGAALRLDNRPGFLDHRLRLTDILDHLTGPVTPAGLSAPGEDGDQSRAGAR